MFTFILHIFIRRTDLLEGFSTSRIICVVCSLGEPALARMCAHHTNTLFVGHRGDGVRPLNNGSLIF